MRRPPSSPPELPGYGYQRVLGSGGFSDVFLYEQALPRREVAVKVLVADQLDAQAKRQFVAEANVMAQLSAHPYIVTIFHADIAGDRPYLVMEYCPGPNLAERYKKERLSVEYVLGTAVRVASAVATAHAAGILHRDIKPANVLTNDYGWPALTDFGIASALEDELPVTTTTDWTGGSAHQTAGSQSAVGLSVPWSPPEMFDDEPTPDVRSDVFSLAATIHTLLAGQTPFEIPGRSNGTLDLIGRIERGQITPIERNDVPASLLAVLRRGMASRREDRYQNALDLARGLQRVEIEFGYAPTSIEVPTTVLTSSARPDADADGDETRVRAVTSIAAQQVQPAPVDVPTDDDDRTRMRPTAVVAQAEDGTVLRPVAVPPTDTAVVPAAPAAPTSRRRRGLVLGIASLAVLLAGGGILAAVLVPKDLGPSEPTPSVADSDGVAISTVITPPTVAPGVRSADGTSVSFAVSSEHPQDGDIFRWARTDSPERPEAAAASPIVVTGAIPGQQLCIDVTVQRSGKTSDPTRACAS
ncbi:serine/threonine protein kinase [Glaciibacter flavus]|uniref:non-specific serine/threonine protein kinase n=1 Tax=Orlajensenia flava TaxID=2565934 RepID=A0A4S4FXR7_9MICO|nr:serine/threonine-protein kinase [Glaciibacter flavus]THG34942.1 serine/threonine protein kinase [Glaciibacter flavus]